MKTVDYVKKYNLSKGINFSHPHFILDFGNDFVSRLEVYKTFSKYSFSKFMDLVDEMENRWFQIEKKTAGNLPLELWDTIYDDIIIPSLDVEFPHIYAIKQKVDKGNIEELKKLLATELDDDIEGRKWYSCRIAWDDIEWEWNHKYSDKSIGELGLQPNFYFRKLEEKVNEKNTYLSYYIFDELTYQLKKIASEKAQIQFRIYLKDKEREKMFDWFDYVYSHGIKVNKDEYIPYFSLMKLTIDAKEEDVKKSYRLMSMTKHPDKGGNKEEFVELTEAKNKCLEYLTLTK